MASQTSPITVFARETDISVHSDLSMSGVEEQPLLSADRNNRRRSTDELQGSNAGLGSSGHGSSRSRRRGSHARRDGNSVNGTNNSQNSGSVRSSRQASHSGGGRVSYYSEAPLGIDPDIFASLPPHVQNEIRSGYYSMSDSSSSAEDENAGVVPSTNLTRPRPVPRSSLRGSRAHSHSPPPAPSVQPPSLRYNLQTQTVQTTQAANAAESQSEQQTELRPRLHERSFSAPPPFNPAYSREYPYPPDFNNPHELYDLSKSGLDGNALANLPDDVLSEVLREEREEFGRMCLEEAVQLESGYEYVQQCQNSPNQEQDVQRQEQVQDQQLHQRQEQQRQQEPQNRLGDVQSRQQSLQRVRNARNLSNNFAAGNSGAATRNLNREGSAESQRHDHIDYTGELNEVGLYHGSGVLINHRTGSRYVGQFWNGFKEGKGTLTLGDGSTYEGWWKMNKCHGYGVRVFPTVLPNPAQASDANGGLRGGGKYEGGYNNGKIDGQGKMTFPNGDVYEGTFSNGAMTGRGKYIFVDEEKFERTFAKHNFPKFVEGKASYYVGGFQNGALEGDGYFHFGNGDTLVGTFRRGMRHGYLKYVTKKDETITECHYLDNVQHGIGIKWSSDKKKAWWYKKNKSRGKLSPSDAEVIVSGIRNHAVALEQQLLLPMQHQQRDRRQLQRQQQVNQEIATGVPMSRLPSIL